ncbi:hypothetical protein K4H03_24560, partial [Mycobacterium tuberculosis]|nr:hypothetical protein [Mycobacterium tuberculosis]
MEILTLTEQLCQPLTYGRAALLLASARRLATWGRVYDNEDLARKAKQMEKQVARLKDEQTELSVGPPWRLVLQGDALPADRLLEMDTLP